MRVQQIGMTNLILVPDKFTPHAVENMSECIKVLIHRVRRWLSDCRFSSWIVPEHCPKTIGHNINMKLRAHKPNKSVA
jgi:hypothetical protein